MKHHVNTEIKQNGTTPEQLFVKRERLAGGKGAGRRQRAKRGKENLRERAGNKLKKLAPRQTRT